MKTQYGYLDFAELFSIEDRKKAKDEWFGFRVNADGVWVVPHDDEKYDRFDSSELTGNDRSLADLQELVKKHEVTDDFGRVVEAYPRSEAADIAYYKGQSNWVGIPNDIREHDHREPLLRFPCSVKELRDFIEKTKLSFMLSPDHELLGIDTSDQATEPQPPPVEDKTYSGWKEICARWEALGQKKVSPRQMKNYRDQGLAIKYTMKGAKKIPTITDKAISDFIYHRTLQKNQK